MKRIDTRLHSVTKRPIACAAVAAAIVGGMPLAAHAQDNSVLACDEIEVISHASPGGGTDTTMRMWIDEAGEELGTDFVVVYKQGGAARLAHEYLASRPADGCTLMATTETHLYTIAQGRTPITIENLQGVARAMRDPSVIVTRSGGEIGTYDELIEASKATEGGLNWGVAQVGGTEHIGIARWAEKAGVPYRVVPFGSGGEMITALRSGAVDATLANVSEALQPIQDGDLEPIAVLADEPVADLPDTPTTASKGASVSVDTTRGYVVLAETPEEKVAALESALLSAMRSERFQEYLKQSGLDPEASIGGAEDWDKQLKEDYTNARAAMEQLGLLEQ